MKNNKEELSLDSATRHILEECRMVLPGIQALFGFQLIAVFNQGFNEKLSTAQQQLHFISIILTVCAVALVMTPAALHRQIDPLAVIRWFIDSSTMLLLLSMFPLGLSISLELYIIAQIITGLSGSVCWLPWQFYFYSFPYGFCCLTLSEAGGAQFGLTRQLANRPRSRDDSQQRNHEYFSVRQSFLR